MGRKINQLKLINISNIKTKAKVNAYKLKNYTLEIDP